MSPARVFFLRGAKNSPAGILVEKHIEYVKLLTRQTYNLEGKTQEELDTALIEVDKTGKDIQASYIVKIKNSCKPEEISSTEKLLSCVNGVLTEGLKVKVPEPDEYMFEKCKEFRSSKIRGMLQSNRRVF